MFTLVMRTRSGKTVKLPMADATIDDVVKLAMMQVRNGRIVLGYLNDGGLTVQRFLPVRGAICAI